jgi:heme/copper-type cytochrome/quinol oxidase subunit 2
MKQRSNWSVSFCTVILFAGIGLVGPVESEALVTDSAETAVEEEIPVKKVKMYARNWKWTPDEIRVKQGTRVIIDFISEDASHGFELKGYKIKVNLPQDKRGHVEFVADKVGTFRWRCSRPCGNGCAKMTGKLIVME